MINNEILIDRNMLEEECAKAPGFFDYWQNREADFKTKAENLEASIALAIRRADDKTLKDEFGLSKITDAAIHAVIRDDKEYQYLRREYLISEANRKSCEKKISMLDVLAKLHGQGYFAKIEGKKDTVDLLAKHVMKKIQEQIKNKAKSKKPKRPK